MEKPTENKAKIKALVGTLFVHGLILLLFLLTVFHNPDPPLFADQAGIEVNFGVSDEGMGNIQPPVETSPKETPQPTTPPKSTPPVEEKHVTQTVEESPVIEKEVIKPIPVKVVPKEPIKEIPKKEEVKPQPTVNTNAIYKGKKTTATATGNEGETGKPGDQGIKEGSLYAKEHGKTMGHGDHGTGEGVSGDSPKGISFSLAGRKMVKVPEIIDRSQETGNVVVTITVDKNGNVVRAVPGARGSTTTSSILYAKAQQAAMKAKFNANPEEQEEQIGTITFKFILQ